MNGYGILKSINSASIVVQKLARHGNVTYKFFGDTTIKETYKGSFV